jgi:hypothetical protein
MRSILLATLVITACTHPRATAPAQPTPQPTQPAPPTPPVASRSQAPDILRIDAGGWPNSDTHRWGTRAYELRPTSSGFQFRIHDAISFQGVGMQPKDMPPTRHTCTSWEAMPSTIVIPTGTRSCTDEPATCQAIEAWLRATAVPRKSPDGPDALTDEPSTTFERGGRSCSE